MLAGEMEVDGDLNVSGDIQSPTIEVLLLQFFEDTHIKNLKTQIHIICKIFYVFQCISMYFVSPHSAVAPPPIEYTIFFIPDYR